MLNIWVVSTDVAQFKEKELTVTDYEGGEDVRTITQCYYFYE